MDKFMQHKVNYFKIIRCTQNITVSSKKPKGWVVHQCQLYINDINPAILWRTALMCSYCENGRWNNLRILARKFQQLGDGESGGVHGDVAIREAH